MSYVYIFTLGTQALFHYCCIASEQEIQKHTTAAQVYSVMYFFVYNFIQKTMFY